MRQNPLHTDVTIRQKELRSRKIGQNTGLSPEISYKSGEKNRNRKNIEKIAQIRKNNITKINR